MTYGHCEDCEYWREATMDQKSGDMIGQCRLNPPAFVLGFDLGHWPQTDNYAGCGQNVSSAAAIAKAEHMKNGICPDCKMPMPECDCIPF